jgi:type II secretory pathway predicted ATPase ExeA
LKHFKILRNPFIDDIQSEKDIYMSDEHRYIEMAMLDAASHGGFLAVIGECGSGKSVMRRKVVAALKKEGDVRVIYPQIIDKTRLNAASICDAIIMDLSEQKPRIRLEAKTRQVHKLLLERSKEGYRSVLMIEEAHDLNVSTLKYLKRFYELEDGFRKLLGIILIGQVELRDLLDETLHIEMREVIRRIQVAEIKGLNGNIRDYLALKFRRVNAKLDDIFEDGALQYIAARLTKEDRHQRKLSYAYPLVVNNLAARAMNRAYEMGEEKVTEDVVSKI